MNRDYGPLLVGIFCAAVFSATMLLGIAITLSEIRHLLAG